jgi:hypothetical protein
VIAIFLFGLVNHPKVMNRRHNRLPANIIMTAVVFVSLLIGMAGLIRALASGLGREPGNWVLTMGLVAGLAVMIMGMVIYRISLFPK